MGEPGRGVHDDRRVVLVAALATLYVVWGSTYLAISVLVDEVPPLTAAGGRFLLAGSLLGLFLLLIGRRRRLVIRPVEMMTAAGVSLLTLFAAFSLLFLGETRVPSALAALLIASVPLCAYVNPLVALFLGWALVDETVGALTLASTAAIVAAVVIVLRREARSAREPVRQEDGRQAAPAVSTLPAERRGAG
ncbi:MAG: EamA family transporter [Actinomycetota bacterium]|nr:EamA family transporter [Actinomycetota bacterium]